jgi:hypothetical protein
LDPIHQDGKPLKVKKGNNPQLTVVAILKEKLFSKGAAPLLRKQLLVPDRVLLIDAVGTVYVWVGSKADAASRQSAMMIAQHYTYSVSAKPSWVRLMRVVQHSELPRFRKCFFQWDQAKRMSNLGAVMSGWGGGVNATVDGAVEKGDGAKGAAKVEEQTPVNEEAKIDVEALVRNRIEHDRDAGHDDDDEADELALALKMESEKNYEEAHLLRVWMLLPVASERLATAAAGADIAKKVAATSFGGDSTHKEYTVRHTRQSQMGHEPEDRTDDLDSRKIQCDRMMLEVPTEEVGIFYSEAEYLIEAYSTHAVHHEVADPVLQDRESGVSAAEAAVPRCAQGHEMKIVKPSRTRTKEGGMKTNVKCQGCGKGLVSGLQVQ